MYFICGRSCDSKNKEISAMVFVAGSDDDGCVEKNEYKKTFNTIAEPVESHSIGILEVLADWIST